MAEDSGYTPSMDRVRDLFSWAYAWRAKDDTAEGETDLSSLRDRQRAEFDRALAAHDAEVRAADAEEIARLRQDVANRDSRLRADIELMNIAGIDGPGAEKALADHDAELLRRAERAELLNQITQEEFRATGAVRAERDALAQQIAAVRAWREQTRNNWWFDARAVDAILDRSPVAQETRARLTAENLPQRSQHDFDIATGRPLGPGVTPESETNR